MIQGINQVLFPSGFFEGKATLADRFSAARERVFECLPEEMRTQKGGCKLNDTVINGVDSLASSFTQSKTPDQIQVANSFLKCKKPLFQTSRYSEELVARIAFLECLHHFYPDFSEFTVENLRKEFTAYFYCRDHQNNRFYQLADGYLSCFTETDMNCFSKRKQIAKYLSKLNGEKGCGRSLKMAEDLIRMLIELKKDFNTRGTERLLNILVTHSKNHTGICGLFIESQCALNLQKVYKGNITYMNLRNNVFRDNDEIEADTDIEVDISGRRHNIEVKSSTMSLEDKTEKIDRNIVKSLAESAVPVLMINNLDDAIDFVSKDDQKITYKLKRFKDRFQNLQTMVERYQRRLRVWNQNGVDKTEGIMNLSLAA